MEPTARPRTDKVSNDLCRDGIREFIKAGPRVFFLSCPLIEKAIASDPIWRGIDWRKPTHQAKLDFHCDSIIRQRLGVARISVRRSKHVRLRSKVIELFCHWRFRKLACDFLIEKGIIELDWEFEIGEKSIGYRLTEKAWKAGIVAVAIPDRKIEKYNAIHRDLRKKGNEKIEAEGIRIDHLLFHLNRLTLDEDKAIHHLEEQYIEWIETGSWKAAESFHSRAFSISALYNKEWRFTRCEAGRLHYILTNLNKKVRKDLRYNGMRLVEADVSCCQPLIAATLYGDDAASQQEKKRYLSLVCSGQFYEELGELAGYQDSERSELKQDILKWVFFGGKTTTYRSGIKLDHRLWQAFLKKLPILARVLMFSKAEINHHNPYKGDSKLALRLQGIESTIFIEKVLGQIATEFPGVPAFPVHDCIMTTRENVELVSDLIIASFLEEIGIAPTVKAA